MGFAVARTAVDGSSGLRESTSMEAIKSDAPPSGYEADKLYRHESQQPSKEPTRAGHTIEAYPTPETFSADPTAETFPLVKPSRDQPSRKYEIWDGDRKIASDIDIDIHTTGEAHVHGAPLGVVARDKNSDDYRDMILLDPSDSHKMNAYDILAQIDKNKALKDNPIPPPHSRREMNRRAQATGTIE